MFKNKGFLYGLGVGLILGAGLLQLMNFAVLDDKTLAFETQSPSPSITPSIAPTKAPIATIKPVTTLIPADHANAPASPSASAISTPAITKTVEPATPTPAAIQGDASGITVLIETGMSSSQVASLLFNKGIIADQKSFDAALSHLKLDRIIRIGSYTFLPNDRDEDIINTITTHK